MLPGGRVSSVAVLEAAAAESQATAAGSSSAAVDFGLSAVHGERARLADGRICCRTTVATRMALSRAYLLPYGLDHTAACTLLMQSYFAPHGTHKHNHPSVQLSVLWTRPTESHFLACQCSQTV